MKKNIICCNDCKHFTINVNNFGRCLRHGMTRQKDDYCSDAQISFANCSTKLFDFLATNYCPHDICKGRLHDEALDFTSEKCDFYKETYKDDACQICWDSFITEVLP